MRVLFHVQHLLGVGHLRRGELITRALAARGIEVTVALGGHPVPEMPFADADVVALPPVSIEGANFKTLYDDAGQPITEAWKAARVKALIDVYDAVRPDVVLMEMFPFGRWRFRFELVPLVEHVKADNRPVQCVTSVRDILVASQRPDRATFAARFARDHLSAVLVHADPTLFTFDETYPHAGEIADLIHYTGYVTEDAERGPGERNGKVVVSAGGGAAAGSLLRTALAARELCPPTIRDRDWHILTGARASDADTAALVAKADRRTIVERFSPRFQALLDGAALSISQAGYNTVMNLLRAKIPAVVVPYEDGGETEQAFRAMRLEQRNLLNVVNGAALSPQTLAAAIVSADARRDRPVSRIDLEGASASAAAIERLIRT
ncbi:glycosyl transferase [Jiella sp. MQZ9-1]|uniref:Glycosyl transferase n=1 Tax=Jiella flava TaxID=2816857 RepID=A0A939FXA5_9HYPH|nr:glycosyltransferase [Jiella flava]MBO0663698.1 glycosyl transferase [Jiella flava]MCD2472271.1 glycosyl transferase [Jiella flava]